MIDAESCAGLYGCPLEELTVSSDLCTGDMVQYYFHSAVAPCYVTSKGEAGCACLLRADGEKITLRMHRYVRLLARATEMLSHV